MKIDLLRRLTLVLGGLGIACSTMTYWASADEGVPVVSGTSIPFNPFERPIVPRTSDGSPAAQTPANPTQTVPPVVSVPSPSLAPRASSFRPAVVNSGSNSNPASSTPAVVAALPAQANTPAVLPGATIQPLPGTRPAESSQRRTAPTVAPLPAVAPSTVPPSSFVPSTTERRPQTSTAPNTTAPNTTQPSLQAPTAPAPVVVAPARVSSTPSTPPVASQPSPGFAPTAPSASSPAPSSNHNPVPSVVARNESGGSFSSGPVATVAPVVTSPVVTSPTPATPTTPTTVSPTAVSPTTVSPSDRPATAQVERLPQLQTPVVVTEPSVAPLPPAPSIQVSRPASPTPSLSSPLPAIDSSVPEPQIAVEPMPRALVAPATVSPASVIPHQVPSTPATPASAQQPMARPTQRNVSSSRTFPSDSTSFATDSRMIQDTQDVILPEVQDVILPEAEMYADEIILDGEMTSVVSDYGFNQDCCRGCPSRSYVIAEGLLFYREGEFSQLSNNFAVDGFDPRVGGRATFGYRGDCLDGWDASYMTVEPWGAIATRAGGGLNAAFLPAGGLVAANVSAFNNADWQEQYYRSELHSAEINRNFWGWDVVTTSYGLRYIRLDEQFRFTSLNGADRGDILISTNNQIFGPQIGSEWFYDIGGRFYLSGKLKVGAFLNVNDGSASLTNTGPVNTIIAGADNNVGFSALGETQFNVFYKLSRNTRLRAGYELWYLYGAATANEQITSRITPFFGRSISDSDDVFFHGASVGFEWVR